MSTPQVGRPDWYTNEDDTAWERMKAAFRRDWQQTKHDFGGKEPDLNQHVGDTVSQAVGGDPIPIGNVRNPDKAIDHDEVYRDSDEPAYQYGFAAHRHYGHDGDWDADTEEALRREFGNDEQWEQKRDAVRRGWFYSRDNCNSV